MAWIRTVTQRSCIQHYAWSQRREAPFQQIHFGFPCPCRCQSQLSAAGWGYGRAGSSFSRPAICCARSCRTPSSPVPNFLGLLRAGGGWDRPGSGPSPHGHGPAPRSRRSQRSGPAPRERARAQPQHGAGRGGGSAGAPFQPSQGSGTRLRTGRGRCSRRTHLSAAEAAGPRPARPLRLLRPSLRHLPLLPPASRRGLTAPGPAHSAASLLGAVPVHQPSALGGDWPAAPSIKGGGLPPPRLPALIGSGEGAGKGLARAARAGLARGESSGDLHGDLKGPLRQGRRGSGTGAPQLPGAEGSGCGVTTELTKRPSVVLLSVIPPGWCHPQFFFFNFFLAAVILRLKLTGGCIAECEEEYVPIQKTLEKHPRLTVIHHRLLQAISLEILTRVLKHLPQRFSTASRFRADWNETLLLTSVLYPHSIYNQSYKDPKADFYVPL